MKQIALGLALMLAAAACVAACDGDIGGDAQQAAAPSPDDPNYSTEVGGDDDDGRSLYFYYGPMKPMLGESILLSIASITGHDFGNWDFTAPEPASQAFITAGNGSGTFYRHCRLLGGCMEHRIPLPRTSFVGTAYVLELEKAVAEACYDRQTFGMFPGGNAPTQATQVVTVIDHQFRLAFATKPSTSDLERSIAYFAAHVAKPEFDDVSALESAGRGHCRALLTTNRFLFY